MTFETFSEPDEVVRHVSEALAKKKMKPSRILWL